MGMILLGLQLGFQFGFFLRFLCQLEGRIERSLIVNITLDILAVLGVK